MTVTTNGSVQTGEADDPAAPYLVGNLSVSVLACRDTAMSV